MPGKLTEFTFIHNNDICCEVPVVSILVDFQDIFNVVDAIANQDRFEDTKQGYVAPVWNSSLQI